MPPIRAIVLDSNVFGKRAWPNVKAIAQWAEACARHDAELWIPEVVVYELAQHAVEAHAKFRITYEAHRRDVKKWGIEADGPMSPIDTDDIWSAIESAGAVIVPLRGEDARDALLDQVLLRGAGQRKSHVKTGAADSAWVRSVIAHNDGDAAGLIVVTADHHALKPTCHQLGVDVPRHVANLGELPHLLDESDVATEPFASLFSSWVQDHFVDRVHRGSRGEPGEDMKSLADIGFSNRWNLPAAPDDGYEAWEEQAMSLSTVHSAEVLGDIEHDRWSGSLSARVELEVEVEEQYARQDPSGHRVEYSARRYPARVRGTVQTFLDGETVDWDGLLEDVEFVPVEAGEVDWESM